MPTGETITLDVEMSYGIGTVKALIKNQTGVPTGIQRLLFGGNQLEDNRTLSDYSIKPGSSMQLVRGDSGRVEACRLKGRLTNKPNHN